MADDPVPLSPAGNAQVEAATAVAIAQETSRAEALESIDNTAVAGAADAIASAEHAADEIALAAIHTRLGQELAAENVARTSWQNAHDQTHQSLLTEIATIKTRMEEIGAQMAEAISRLPPIQVEVPLSTPVASGPATEAAIVIVPGSENSAPIEAQSAVPAAKKRIRLI